jgi:CysZ protein
MINFWYGVSAYGKAISHVSKHGLWAYVLLPGILCALIGFGLFGAAWGLSDDIGGLLYKLWPWQWGRSVVDDIAQVFGGLVVLVLGLLVFRQIVMVVSSPIMSILSEKVENQLLGKKESDPVTFHQIISDIVRGLRIALRNISRELLLTIFLLLLGLIPGFAIITTPLVFVAQAYYAGFGNLDFALERRFRYHESIRFVHDNRMLAVGNGAVFMLLLFTFVGFLFALPLGTVAATIETTRRLSMKN